MKRFVAGLALTYVLGITAASAQSDAIRSEFAAALRDAQATQTSGPSRIMLAGEAVLQLPAGHVFVPMPAAARLIKAMGNTPDPHLVGLIFPGHEDNWMMAIQYENTGHIREDDARDWNVDDLLRSVRAGTERGNEERRRLGLPEIEVLGWAEKPHYDEATHRLVWAVAARDKGSPNADEGANYNTYALGRDGYFKLNLVTDLKDLPTQKPAADAIFASLEYLDGKKYTDFNPATDPVADFGIASLVAGIAAKKLGAATLALQWGAHHKKLILLGVLVVLGGFGWLVLKQGRRTMDHVSRPDDFPPTEIATVALDQPTIVMPRKDAPAPSDVGPASMRPTMPDPGSPAVSSRSIEPVDATVAPSIATIDPISVATPGTSAAQASVQATSTEKAPHKS